MQTAGSNFFNRKLNPPENFSCVAKCTRKAFNRCVFIPTIRGAALWAGLYCVRLGWLKLQKLCHLLQNNCTQCSLKPFKNYIHYCHLSKSVALAAPCELHVVSWHFFFFYLHINMVFKKENHTQYKRKKKRWQIKSHQLCRDPCSRSSLMWQWAPHSSLDQSRPNRSPISRQDMIEEPNTSPRDPCLWRGNGERRGIKVEEKRGTEGKRDRSEKEK